MRNLPELSGALLRAAAEALAAAPPDEETALREATGLDADELPLLHAALFLVGDHLDRVANVYVHGPGELTGDGEMRDGLEYVIELLPRHRKKPLPELVRVVRKADKPAPLPAIVPEAKPVLPSSPPKHDLPVGRGLFSSAGRRDSPRPGVLPVPMAEKPADPAKPGFVAKPHGPKSGGPGFKRASGGPGFKRASGSPGFKRASGGPGFKRTSGGPGFKSAGGGPGFKRTSGGPGFKSASGGPGFKRASGGPGFKRPGGAGGFKRTSGPRKGFKPGPKRS